MDDDAEGKGGLDKLWVVGGGMEDWVGVDRAIEGLPIEGRDGG